MTGPDKLWRWWVQRRAEGVVVSLSGELDLASVDELRDRLTATIGVTPVVEVDLAAVRFIDSTVISVLVAAHHAAKTAGGRLALLNCTGQVRRVLQITGVLPLLGPDDATCAPPPSDV